MEIAVMSELDAVRDARSAVEQAEQTAAQARLRLEEAMRAAVAAGYQKKVVRTAAGMGRSQAYEVWKDVEGPDTA